MSTFMVEPQVHVADNTLLSYFYSDFTNHIYLKKKKSMIFRSSQCRCSLISLQQRKMFGCANMHKECRSILSVKQRHEVTNMNVLCLLHRCTSMLLCAILQLW